MRSTLTRWLAYGMTFLVTVTATAVSTAEAATCPYIGGGAGGFVTACAETPRGSTPTFGWLSTTKPRAPTAEGDLDTALTLTGGGVHAGWSLLRLGASVQLMDTIFSTKPREGLVATDGAAAVRVSAAGVGVLGFGTFITKFHGGCAQASGSGALVTPFAVVARGTGPAAPCDAPVMLP